jgi:phytoene synthase
VDEARAAVRARVEAAGTSFYWAMRVLPEPRRDAMFAIYAFCREVDDIADGTDSPEIKRRDLDAWRREIDALFTGGPATTTGRALLEPTRAFGLRREDFLAIVDGMEMDAAEIRAPGMAELDLYCDRVASAVGRLSVRAFGVATEAADRVAHSLGRALQLTNILRDLDEDAGTGRLYLPREALREAGVISTDPAAVLANPMLGEVCNTVAERARQHFSSAGAVMSRNPRRLVRAPRIMGEVYRVMLEGMAARGWTSPRTRVSIGGLRLSWIALRYAVI